MPFTSPAFPMRTKYFPIGIGLGSGHGRTLRQLIPGARQRDRRRQREGSAALSGMGRQAFPGRAEEAPNQFHNFKERDTDYDALVLKQVKEWVGSGKGEGASEGT